MDSRFNSPAEIASLVSKSGVTKSMLSLPKMILLGLMAGAFIAFGGAASDVAMHGVADVGLARVVAGVIFPVGLMLVVFTGSELFTGNCLMIIPTLEKKIKPVSMIKNLVTVYISNFVGAMIIDLLSCKYVLYSDRCYGGNESRICCKSSGALRYYGTAMSESCKSFGL